MIPYRIDPNTLTDLDPDPVTNLEIIGKFVNTVIK
jgi:hypothetical protein